MHLTELLYFITAFGDQAVVLPFAIAVAIVLAATSGRPTALAWCVALAASLGGSLIAKIIFISCGHLLPGLDIRSPSGHTTAAIAAYGGFATLWAKLARTRWTRAFFAAGAIASCSAIAASRILLHMHSAPEVLLGALIGLAAPIILYRTKPAASELRAEPTLLLLFMPLCLVFFLHGTALPIESKIDEISKALTALLGICS